MSDLHLLILRKYCPECRAYVMVEEVTLPAVMPPATPEPPEDVEACARCGNWFGLSESAGEQNVGMAMRLRMAERVGKQRKAAERVAWRQLLNDQAALEARTLIEQETGLDLSHFAFEAIAEWTDEEPLRRLEENGVNLDDVIPDDPEKLAYWEVTFYPSDPGINLGNKITVMNRLVRNTDGSYEFHRYVSSNPLYRAQETALHFNVIGLDSLTVAYGADLVDVLVDGYGEALLRATEPVRIEPAGIDEEVPF